MEPTGDVSSLTQAARGLARAEHAAWAAMVAFRGAERAHLNSVEVTPLDRLLGHAQITVKIAQAMGLSEGQVGNRLAVADRIMEHTPQVWEAFGAGRVDAARVQAIGQVIERLEHESSCERLDAMVVDYATAHTVGELRAWLRRFVVRTEPEEATKRCERARTERRVEFIYDEDGMTWVRALVESHLAAAINTRLWNQARALKRGNPAESRTIAQCEVDLLADALLNTPTSEAVAAGHGPAGVKIDIAVTFDADTMIGATDGHAEATDGNWTVPAHWVLDTALTGEAFWHRLLLDPFTGNTLAHEYNGYSAPPLLRRAIRFRNGVCATPGCMVPAERCELDHRIPWPEGPTSGANLDPRCKKHHALKGHGLLPPQPL